MTNPSIDNEYTLSSVVSLDIICLTFIVATLMLLKVVAADIGSTYIQTFIAENWYMRLQDQNLARTPVWYSLLKKRYMA